MAAAPKGRGRFFLRGTLDSQKAYGEVMEPVIELDGLEVRFGQRTILNKLKAGSRRC
jgi:hypothetical protein